MNTSSIIEVIGYIGSALVLAAFLLTSVVKLRVVNSIGSLIFAIYALIIHSYPTALMNICLVVINICFLRKLKTKKTNYQLVCLSPCENFVTFFLNSYANDINKYFPGWSGWDKTQWNCAFLICCKTEVTGILIGSEKNDMIEVALEYSTPEYRDCSVGSFLLACLKEKGIQELRYYHPSPEHIGYLKKMGYVYQNGYYQRSLL